jgi:hypothetical protein
MTIHPHAVLVRWFFLIGLLLVVGKISFDLLTHPAVVTTAGAQAPVYSLLLVFALLIYGWFALFRTRDATASEHIVLRQGSIFGLLCGGVWILELLTANLLGPHLGSLNLVLYYGFVFLAYLLPGLAGLRASWRAGRLGSGLEAGLLCGMFGGLMIFLAAIIIPPLFLGTGPSDPQTIREFQHSGLPDITTFLVGDFLAGLIAHLWLGLLTGLGLGMVGGVLGKVLATSGRRRS